MSRQDAFHLLFRGLARHAPGTEEATLRALAACEELPEHPRVADLGAGTGAATLALVEELDGRLERPIVAVDRDPESLQTLRDRAGRRGFAEGIVTREADASEPLEEAPFDLIWAEGVIYAVGWAEALTAWTPMLANGGYLVVTDAVRSAEMPPEAREFWEEAYPAMATRQELEARAREAGFEVVESFELPDEAWERYYQPLESRAGLALDAGSTAPDMRAAAGQIAREIHLYRKFGEAWDYLFLILRKND